MKKNVRNIYCLKKINDHSQIILSSKLAQRGKSLLECQFYYFCTLKIQQC